MRWGLLRQFPFLTMVDQPVFVHIFPVLGPPITVRGISARRRRHSTNSALRIDLFRHVLFFVIILCSGRSRQIVYELGYNGPDRWFMI